MDIALRNCVHALLCKCIEEHIALYGFGILKLFIGGTPVELFKSLLLALFIGKEEGELLKSYNLISVCLRFNADKFVSGVGTEMIALSVNFERRKSCRAEIFTESGFCGICAPCAGYYYRGRISCREVRCI